MVKGMVRVVRVCWAGVWSSALVFVLGYCLLASVMLAGVSDYVMGVCALVVIGFAALFVGFMVWCAATGREI